MVRAEEGESHARLGQLASSSSIQSTVWLGCAFPFLKLPANWKACSTLTLKGIDSTVRGDEIASHSLCLIQWYGVVSHAVFLIKKNNKTLKSVR